MILRDSLPLFSKSLVLLCLGSLVGCEILSTGPLFTPSTNESAPLPEVTSGPESVEESPVTPITVSNLLNDAEIALQLNQLTTPDHDNAYDRFRAVLLLQPGNADALAGIAEISRRYHELIEAALTGQNWPQAETLLERADFVDSLDPRVRQLRSELQRRKAQALEFARRTPEPANDKEIFLDAIALAAKRETAVVQLQELARKIRETDESLLIFARNDAEGRWIYQRMSEAVPGYRLRGDIRLSNTPKVQLLPPL